MAYSVKNVKTFQGREGYGFECSLYKDGKRVGTITNTADGGMVDFYLNQGEKEILDAHCKTLPKRKHYFEEGKMEEIDAELFISRLVDDFETNKEKKRWCKKQIVFCLKGDKEGSFRTIKGLYTAKIGEAIRTKYGEKVEEIVNETILQ